MGKTELETIEEREKQIQDLIEDYEHARLAREIAQQLEGDLFNQLTALARPAGENREIAVAQTKMITFKGRENIKVDHSQVDALWGVVGGGIIDGITREQFPFVRKYVPDRTKLNALRQGDPDAYADLVAPLITLTPGKPQAEVKSIEQV